jgi:hypothetical protein
MGNARLWEETLILPLGWPADPLRAVTVSPLPLSSSLPINRCFLLLADLFSLYSLP